MGRGQAQHTLDLCGTHFISQRFIWVCSLAMRKIGKSGHRNQHDHVCLCRHSRLQARHWEYGKYGKLKNMHFQQGQRCQRMGVPRLSEYPKNLMGSFQPRKPDLNKCNWQSHSSQTTHTSFQEQGQPAKRFSVEVGRKAAWWQQHMALSVCELGDAGCLQRAGALQAPSREAQWGGGWSGGG